MSTDKIFRIDWVADPQSDYRKQTLRVWNADGSRLHEIALPADLNPSAGQATEQWVYPVRWELLRSGSELYLIGSKFSYETFVFDLDERSGTVINPDEMVTIEDSGTFEIIRPGEMPWE